MNCNEHILVVHCNFSVLSLWVSHNMVNAYFTLEISFLKTILNTVANCSQRVTVILLIYSESKEKFAQINYVKCIFFYIFRLFKTLDSSYT